MRSRLARRGTAAATVTGEGIVLTRARPETVLSWAKRGLGPVVVVPMGAWTLVNPGGRPRARYPYDDAVRTLAGRPASYRMRPAIGFFRVGRQAVVTLHPRHRFAQTRWLIWTPRDGVVQPRGLPVARPADIAAAAGVGSDGVVDFVEEILADVGATAQEILAALLGVLDLPGLEILSGKASAADVEDARLVVPADRYARAFDKIVQQRRQDEDPEPETDEEP